MEINYSQKFDPNYKLIIQDVIGDYHTILSHTILSGGNSFAVSLNIEKTNTTTPNACSIKIYNLSQTTRKLFKKSRLDTNIYRAVEIYAGYRDNLALLFKGNILTAYSYRENENVVTMIECYCDYGIINGFSNIAVTKDFTTQTLMYQLAKDLPNVEVGYITKKNDMFNIGARGRTYQGKTWDIITSINEKNDVFIDDNKLYIMSPDEIRTTNILKINSFSGLLQEPREYSGYLEIKTLFEPLAVMNGLCTIESEFAPEYSGEYKIIGIKHNLNIEQIGRRTEATTTFNLLFGSEEFKKTINQIEL